MTFMLVVQFPYYSETDFDYLISLENEIGRSIGELGEVDGHDWGQGEMNLFIRTADPKAAFGLLKEQIRMRADDRPFKAAYRPEYGEDHEIIWPPGLTEFRVR